LKHEIRLEAINVSSDLSLELLNLDPIQFRKVPIQHYLLASNQIYLTLYYFRGDYWLHDASD
jgi:hypothetical protein